MRISIIVPVYNVETYVVQCVNSIRSQSYKDIEIILVDDGSSDRSGLLIDLLAKVDSRIKAIHITNNGVSHARNVGLDLAEGDIVFFVDADDLIEPRACEVISKSFTDYDVDLIKFSAEPFPRQLSSDWVNNALRVPDELIERDFVRLSFLVNSKPYPWNGAYRAEFLKKYNLRFPEDISIGEDQVFSFATLGRAKNALLVSDVLYRYRVWRKDSAIALSFGNEVKKLVGHQDVMACILDDWALQEHMDGEGARRILTFLAIFIIVDICELDDEEGRDLLLNKLRSILRSRYTREDISRWLDGDYVLKWILKVYDYEGDVRAFGGPAIYSLIRSIYGRRAAFDRRRSDVLGSIRAFKCKKFGESPKAISLRAEASDLANRTLVEDRIEAQMALNLLSLELNSGNH